MLLSSTPPALFFQAMQKIRLANHIKSMAELLHADTIQQLEVALLGSPGAHLLNLLATRVMQSASASQRQMIHLPQAYTTTLIAPSPSTIPIVGLTNSSLSVVSAYSSGTEATTSVSQGTSPKHCCIVPTSIQSHESFPLPSVLPLLVHLTNQPCILHGGSTQMDQSARWW